MLSLIGLGLIGTNCIFEDFGEVLKAKPEVLVVGKGCYGLVKIMPETEKILQNGGIRLIAEKLGKPTRFIMNFQNQVEFSALSTSLADVWVV
jgi:hypothetical protein